MALTSTEQLFTERPLYRCFFRNNHLPYLLQTEAVARRRSAKKVFLKSS